MPMVLSAIGTILSSVFQAIVNGFPRIMQLGTQLVSRLAGSISTAVRRVVTVGSDLIRGLWRGMNNVKDWIIGKISGFMDSVVGSLKSFFGINSPSKLFRDEIGRFLPQGLAGWN
ncbi:phage tail protein [Shouchella lehensis]|uniref:Uncharacterized protein n=1 Tax=Shouchella lehensis G1 TaxID=1246626 RepID=A0A060LZV1_9BACI|nr:hypothetical protein [Shouchella lehensis]AIC93833.1 hypothetical protein BleG1_1250 [Shouchella lehensis G1]